MAAWQAADAEGEQGQQHCGDRESKGGSAFPPARADPGDHEGEGDNGTQTNHGRGMIRISTAGRL
jgi:hypothetical protein